MSRINSLKIKLLIPTIITAFLIGVAISYISILHYRIFEQQHEHHNKTHVVEIKTTVKEAILELENLAEFLIQDWRIINGLLTQDRDTLLDLITPFHDAIGFDIINIYNPDGNLIIQSSNESVFGIPDELYSKALLHNTKIETKPTIEVYNQKLALIVWEQLENNIHGSAGVIAVGFYLENLFKHEHIKAHNLQLIIQYGEHVFYSQHTDDFKHGYIDHHVEHVHETGNHTSEHHHYDNTHAHDPLLKDIEPYKTTIDLNDLVGASQKLHIEMHERHDTYIEAKFWQELSILVFILSIISIITIIFSYYQTFNIIARLQKAKMIAESAMGSLEKAKQQAESANRAKSAFLANMSHELRTPLNGILGYAQILIRDKELNKRQLEGIHVIQRSGDYLLTLINDVLDLSKIEAERLELTQERVNLAELLQSVVELFNIRAQQKDIAFIYEPVSTLPQWIETDEKRLRQILINLIGNSIKFTDEGCVSLILETNDSHITFHIKDTGIGIKSEDIDHIFEPFQQVGDHSRAKSEGTGLGLPITRKLVQMMGGNLQVESSLGEGSHFWFELAFNQIETSETQIQLDNRVITSYLGSPKKILVIDDKVEDRFILAELLKSVGFSTAEASNGEYGIKATLEAQPDLVLVDLVMPTLNGFEYTQKIRELPELFDGLPIIAVSASVFETHQQESLDAGCNTFLPKPIRQEALLAVLQEYLDIEWIYETEHNYIPIIEEVIPCENGEIILDCILSNQQVTELAELSLQGDVSSILDMLDDLEQTKKNCPLTRKVNKLAQNFDVELIYEMMQKYQQNNLVQPSSV